MIVVDTALIERARSGDPSQTPTMGGDRLDGLGGYMTYGLCENRGATREHRLLPIGLVEGSVLLCDVAKDELISIDDVVFPDNTEIHRLRIEQDAVFDMPVVTT